MLKIAPFSYVAPSKPVGLRKPSQYAVNTVVPQPIGRFLFDELCANIAQTTYGVDRNKDIKLDRIKNYLSVYWPRSYGEAFALYSELFALHPVNAKKTLSLLSFGCGTAGDIVGFLCAAKRHHFHGRLTLYAVDINANELEIVETLLAEVSNMLDIDIDFFKIHCAIIEKNYQKLTSHPILIGQQFDYIHAFKSLNEVVNESAMETRAFEQFIEDFTLLLSANGFLTICDVNTRNENKNCWNGTLLSNACINFLGRDSSYCLLGTCPANIADASVSALNGRNEILAQFAGLPETVPQSEIFNYRVIVPAAFGKTFDKTLPLVLLEHEPIDKNSFANNEIPVLFD